MHPNCFYLFQFLNPAFLLALIFSINRGWVEGLGNPAPPAWKAAHSSAGVYQISKDTNMHKHVTARRISGIQRRFCSCASLVTIASLCIVANTLRFWSKSHKSRDDCADCTSFNAHGQSWPLNDRPVKFSKWHSAILGYRYQQIRPNIDEGKTRSIKTKIQAAGSESLRLLDTSTCAQFTIENL